MLRGGYPTAIIFRGWVSHDAPLKIFIDRLREQGRQEVTCSLPGEWMGVHEASLLFQDPVQLEGEAYLADDYVVLHCNAATIAQIPCSICNEWVAQSIEVLALTQAEPIADAVKGAIDFGPTVRDALLLEVPHFLECHGGHCPQRQQLQLLLKTQSHTNNPFKDL
jgi:uncharacterized metal-binding protein YceD (DUF177 family)